MDRKQENLRFCFITTFYPPYNFGGDGLTTKRLADALVANGHEVDVLFLPGAYELLSGKNVEVDDADSAVRSHGFRGPLESLSLLAAQQSGHPLGKMTSLKKFFTQQFDVIHFHNISLWGPKILSFGSGLKLYTLHEYWLICPTHVMVRFNQKPCHTPKHCDFCTLAQKRPPQLWRHTNLLKNMIPQVDQFLCASEFARDLHKQIIPEEKLIRMSHFTPDPPPPSKKGWQPNTFLFVGRLERIKGLHTLIPLFRESPQMRLLVAGDGSQMHRLKAMAGNSPNIEFLGHVAGRALDRLYDQSGAVVMPSLSYEISPGVIMEAYARRTPVIAHEIGSIPEFLDSGGLLYTTESQLKAHIENLSSNVELICELGEKGYRHYRDNWTKEGYLRHYFNIIDKAGSTDAED